MGEKLEVYDLNGNSLGVQNRAKYYKQILKEWKEKGKISRKIRVIHLLLMNSQGKLVIQRRNREKEGNPGLYDKTMGGHVAIGETPNMTIIRESAEELGFPVSIVSDAEFEGGVSNIDLRVVGLFKKIDKVSDFVSKRLTSEEEFFEAPQTVTMYIGFYDGPIQFIDGESVGIELFSLKELQLEIAKEPSRFTEDLKYMIEKYKKHLVPL